MPRSNLRRSFLASGAIAAMMYVSPTCRYRARHGLLPAWGRSSRSAQVSNGGIEIALEFPEPVERAVLNLDAEADFA